MVAQKTKVASMLTCEKCGSIMAIRMVVIRNGDPSKVKLMKIVQCVVCKHWRKCDE